MRVHAAKIFCGRSVGEMSFEIPENFDIFSGFERNTFMAVGILRKYFRRKLLQFE